MTSINDIISQARQMTVGIYFDIYYGIPREPPDNLPVPDFMTPRTSFWRISNAISDECSSKMLRSWILTGKVWP